MFSALSNSPQPFVTLGSSENGCVDFGLVSYREKPWRLGNNRRYAWVYHRPCLFRLKRLDTQDLFLESAVDDAGFVGVEDRMPGSVSCSPPSGTSM